MRVKNDEMATTVKVIDFKLSPVAEEEEEAKEEISFTEIKLDVDP